MSKIKQILLAVTKLKAAVFLSKNSPAIDLDKIDALQNAILRRARYEEYRAMNFAILSHRLCTNPITNKAIARYVWDLHEMNLN